MPDDDFDDYEELDNNQRLAPIAFQGMHFNVIDVEKFNKGLELIKESLEPVVRNTLIACDNLITWNKNYCFFRQKYFFDYVNNQENPNVERSIIWRTYILLYLAKKCLKIDGDFIELGCHSGSTAQHIIDQIDLGKANKDLVLYDLFGWKEGDQHTRHAGHESETMYEDVVARFAPYPFVKIVKGFVPASFAEHLPDKIAFAHIDMNHPTPEVGALKHILPRLSPGAIVIFDDYGWWFYSAQKNFIDQALAPHGLEVMELPTGQGILIN
jgi:O-methyltransferase